LVEAVPALLVVSDDTPVEEDAEVELELEGMELVPCGVVSLAELSGCFSVLEQAAITIETAHTATGNNFFIMFSLIVREFFRVTLQEVGKKRARSGA
jgi:hypothetical protein